ncbi:hypothetical protein Leryth_023755 [Lithospermum erythrorhizon]|nr:hypothetical protein Leryth_023755 [Lithospermum erythrorhizon]
MVVKRWIETGDVWKEGAKAVQLRLRERLRVAVNRRPKTRSFFSSSLLPSSSVFYRKSVGKEVDAEGDSVISRMLQAVAVPVIGNVCHVFMHGLNRVQVYGAEKLQHALLNRPKNKPLVTVSNHVASMDDPLVIASLLPPRVLMDAQNLRWTLCATDRCFRNPLTSAFFTYVKVLPVSRGDGIYQKGMDMAISKLNKGEWVHIFPEGSRSRDDGKTMGSPKRGIGRLILDSDEVPIVIPFVHTGMQDIMPIGAKVPRIGKIVCAHKFHHMLDKVTVLIGDPIDLEDITNMENSNVSRGDLYDAVSSRIGSNLQRLKTKVDALAVEQSLESQDRVQQATDPAAGIFQQVDWESLGMDDYVRTEEYSSLASPRKEQLPAEVCSKKVEQEIRRDQTSIDKSLRSRIHGLIDLMIAARECL